MDRSRSNRSQLYLLEFSVMLLNFGNFLPAILLVNQIMKQACIKFGYDDSVCKVINQNGEGTAFAETELQPYVAKINLVIFLIHASVPAILQLFLGPWSDKHGRKTVLNMSAIGFVITHLSAALACYYSENVQPLSPWIYVFCYIPINFLGGYSTLVTTTLCFITDTCEESKRSYHFTLVEIIIVFSIFCSVLACSLILSLSSTTIVFITAAACVIVGAVIVIFFVDESVEVIESECESILSTTHITEMIRTCFKRRVLYERGILLSLVLILAFNKVTLDAPISVGYLFERTRFNWTLEDHNLFQSASIVVTVVGTLSALYVLKKLMEVSDMVLLCLAILSNIMSCFLEAFATKTWQMYAISSVSFLRLIVHPICRSLISSIVSAQEIGKIMSFTASTESIANFIAPPVFVSVYEATYKTFPGAFMLVAAAVAILTMFFALAVMVMKSVTASVREKYAQIE
jgi:PCFT/HCP family folate transporter-like MFS transporter 1/3